MLAATGLPPVTPLDLLLRVEPGAPLAGCVLAAGWYLLGVRALRGRGAAWAGGRTVALLLGLLVVAYATSGGVATVDRTRFAAHMAQHMLLAMVAPLLLALGAPVTLALRTLPAAPRRALVRLLHARAARLLGSLPVGWVLVVATPFGLYFTGLYEASLRHPWLHALVHVHFLASGCVFLWALVGVDPVPGRVAHGFRVLAALAALPVHAFLGVALMSSSDVIAGSWYRAVTGASAAALLDEQHLGGALLWGTGDLVGLGLLVALISQWMRADERAARRGDRQADRDDDRALEAANARLAALAAGQPRPAASAGPAARALDGP